MTNFRRQTIVIAVLIVLIAVAGFYAKRFNDTVKDASSKSKTSSNFFTESKMARDNQASVKKQELEAIVNNENSSAEAKNAASAELMALADRQDKQSSIESLIKEKGFEDAVCIIDDKGIEVSIKHSEAVTKEQANQIKEIVVKKTSIAPSSITVKQRTK